MPPPAPLGLIYGSTKPNQKASGWLYQTKIHITRIVYQENYRSIPPYFMALYKCLLQHFHYPKQLLQMFIATLKCI